MTEPKKNETDAEKFGKMLDAKVASGKMTKEEAEDELQDFMNRGEGRWGWGTAR